MSAEVRVRRSRAAGFSREKRYAPDLPDRREGNVRTGAQAPGMNWRSSSGVFVYETAMGSWTYPEPSVLRIGGVPLFTGFGYTGSTGVCPC